LSGKRVKRKEKEKEFFEGHPEEKIKKARGGRERRLHGSFKTLPQEKRRLRKVQGKTNSQHQASEATNPKRIENERESPQKKQNVQRYKQAG